MLVSISEELLRVGRERVAAADAPDAAVAALVDWHVDFALRHRPLIVVQDRDWESLPTDARERVRTLQREYVDLWAAQLRRADPGLDLTIEAMVVLPVPGGPHSSNESDFSPSMSCLRGLPGARSCAWPTPASTCRPRGRWRTPRSG